MALKHRVEEEVFAKKPDCSRREKERFVRRQSILDAAELVFGKKGYHDASMAEIARIAEFGVGYLYRFFQDKGDLFLAVLERKFEALEGALRAALSLDGSAKTRLSTMIGVHLAFFEANRTFFKLFIDQGRNAPSTIQEEYKTRIIPKFLAMRAEVSSVLKEGIMQGEIRDTDTEHLTSALFGILHGFMGHWIYTNAHTSLSTLSTLVTQIFFDGVSKESH